MTERRIVDATWLPNSESLPGAGDVPLALRCEATVSDIRFDASVLPICALQFSPMLEGVLLEAIMRVPDRDVSDRIEMTEIGRVLLCPWIVLQRNGPEYLVGWLRETVANLMAHEVSESLAYRGRRVFDPHAPLS